MEFSRLENFLVVIVIIAILICGASFVLKNINYPTMQAEVLDTQISSPLPPPPPPPPQKLANPPAIIKAVYVTEYSAGSKKYLDYLSNLFKNSEINAVAVDIKGSDGKTGIYDANSLVRFLHSQNIYVIGRIAVFEDPVFAKARPALAIYDKTKTTNILNPILWRDNNGLEWLDPASKDVWDYDISLAKDAFDNHGFDEIIFDYVRFPSDGNTGDMGFPVYDGKTLKAEVIKNFFHYVRTNLAGQKISVDLFGQTTTTVDGMGIGQVIENAFENFDYISPMVYPSHYINGFIGFSNPAEHPYEVVKYSMDGALAKEKVFVSSLPLAKFRPWLQDFNMGAVYTSDMVKQEIKATQDSLGENYAGFMLWNPSNIYNFTY